jgi:preprotein translocase subunit SecA
MRLFATGAMNWVMGKTFPDDVPLEAKMVTRAIERAQRTVEDRNFEIRKDVLKYDEVMNEQRKVIYKRRQQILDGGDLREESLEAIEGAIDHVVKAACGDGDFSEDWDLDELLLQAQDIFPTRVSREQLNDLASAEVVFELLHGDAVEQYEAKEVAVGEETLREIERRVMLSVIDQKWREHLYEMDYLREGINLRAMGQRDPLAEWQREGFDMFEAMMEGTKDDFVRYIFRLEVVADDAPRPVRNLRYSAAEDPVQGSGGFAAAALAGPIEELGMEGPGPGPAPIADEPQTIEPVRVEKTPGRNEPCYCGSGKKYKLCHGK